MGPGPERAPLDLQHMIKIHTIRKEPLLKRTVAPDLIGLRMIWLDQGCESRRQTYISRNLKSLGATEIANAVRKKSLAGIETAIRFFETQPRWERDPDR